MIGVQLGYIKVSPCSPRLTVTMGWGCQEPVGIIALYVRRVGEPAEFAMYPALEVNGSQITFEFDELLFVKEQGRYEGRLVVGVKYYGRIQFEYSDPIQILAVE